MNMASNMGFVETLDRHFPGAIPEGEFVAETAQFPQSNRFGRVQLLAAETRHVFQGVSSQLEYTPLEYILERPAIDDGSFAHVLDKLQPCPDRVLPLSHPDVHVHPSHT